MTQKPNDRENQSGAGTFVAIGLCVAFYLGWNQYLTHKYPDYNKPKSETAAPVTAEKSPDTEKPAAPASDKVQDNTTAALAPATPAEPQVVQLTKQDLTYTTGNAEYVFKQDLGALESIKLKGYHEHIDPTSSSVELLNQPLVVQTHMTPTVTSLGPVQYSVERNDNKFDFSRVEGNWKINQIWELPKTGYVGKLTVKMTNQSSTPQELQPFTYFQVGANHTKKTGSFFMPGSPNEQARFLTQADGSDDFTVIEKFCDDKTKEVLSKNKKLDFFGFDHHYFAVAFVPELAADYKTKFSTQKEDACQIITSSSLNFGAVAPGESSQVTWSVWMGPKDVELLSDFNPHLRTTLGLGWLDMIAHPLLLSIKGLYKFTGNYGIAIILLTLLLKILFYPLAKQAAVSAAKMKKLNPEMTKIREKFKSEPQKMQMELMKFMSQNKINPMKGCLPILPTIPVFFALFRVLSASIDLRHAPFYGWINDLSAMDPYFVTPIILTGCMFVQQKLTPMTGMDPTQEKIMTYMPLIFGVMMISLPSGLVLYMLTNTIVSIAQQQYLNKKLA